MPAIASTVSSGMTTAPSADAFHRQIVTEFDVYESVGCDNEGTVLFTGYCTPTLRASRTRTDVYRYPLHRPPKDLLRDDRGAVVQHHQLVHGVLQLAHVAGPGVTAQQVRRFR